MQRTYLSIRQRIRSITLPEDVLKGREFEDYVLELFDGKSITELCKIFGRNQGAIASRLRKLNR